MLPCSASNAALISSMVFGSIRHPAACLDFSSFRISARNIRYSRRLTRPSFIYIKNSI